MTTKRALLLAVLLSITGCGSDDGISRTMQIVIPAEIPTIPRGTVYLSLWSYDPGIADAAATLLDVQQTSFQHNTGQVTTVYLRVSGRPRAGWRHYLTVAGCAPDAGGATRVFWAYVSSDEQTMAIVQPQTSPAPCSATG